MTSIDHDVPSPRRISAGLDRVFEPTHADASMARHAAREHLIAAGLPPAITAELELAVAELITNAVDQHPSEPVRLLVAVTASDVVVTVENETTGAPPLPRHDRGVPPIDAEAGVRERGWGLRIVEAVTDELRVEQRDGWTIVSCRRLLGRPKA